MSDTKRTLTARILACIALVSGTALAPVPAFASHNDGAAAEEPRAMLLFPLMDPERGRRLFAHKGCVVCHSVNGVGADHAPPLDFDPERGPINPFQVAADMWAHAATMIPLQEEELGRQIELSADEFADLTAFLASPAEQKRLTVADIPPEIRERVEHHHHD